MALRAVKTEIAGTVGGALANLPAIVNVRFDALGIQPLFVPATGNQVITIDGQPSQIVFFWAAAWGPLRNAGQLFVKRSGTRLDISGDQGIFAITFFVEEGEDD